jgi:integrase
LGLTAMEDGVKVEVEYKHLLRDHDRHGNERIYYRPPSAAGQPRKPMIRLHKTPGTEAFHEEYRKAVNGETAPKVRMQRAKAGTFRWLVEQYYESADFKTLGPSTQSARRGILEGICLSRTKETKTLRGSLPFAKLEQQYVEDIRDEKLDLPEAANGRIKAVRRLYDFAISKKWLRHNPTEGVEYLASAGDGFHTWSVEEVRQYEARHPVGTKARLALGILLFTGVRRSDAVKLGPGMEREGVDPETEQPIEELHFTETKGATSRALGRKKKPAGPKRRVVPILPELRSIIDAAPSGHMTYLVTEWKKSFTPNGFGNWFRDRCDEAGLKHCSAHGLRKAGATIAADNGATAHQLMSIYGWETLRQAEVYTKKANRDRLARGAMHLVVPPKPNRGLR